MSALQAAICKLAANDEFWDGQRKTAGDTPPAQAQQSGGIDRAQLMALLGGAALPGVGALTGKMDAKQLLMLALLGGGLGYGGSKLYDYLTPEAKGEGVERTSGSGDDTDSDLQNRSTAARTGTSALVGTAGGAGAGALGTLGAWGLSGPLASAFNRSSVRDITRAKTPREAGRAVERNMQRIDPEYNTKNPNKSPVKAERAGQAIQDHIRNNPSIDPNRRGVGKDLAKAYDVGAFRLPGKGKSGYVDQILRDVNAPRSTRIRRSLKPRFKLSPALRRNALIGGLLGGTGLGAAGYFNL